MRKILFLLAILISNLLMAQEGSVGIGIQTPNEKAVLHLVAPNNDQGFLVPKLTTTQRNNFSSQLTSNENGMMVYDSDLNQFFFWLTDHWEAVGSSLQAGDGLEIVDGVINNTGDADASDDFTGDWTDLVNIPIEFMDGTDDVDDADNDPTNELQDLNLSGDILTISGLTTPTQIDLSAYTDTNTDEQDLQFSAGQLSLTGDPDNTIIDLSAYDSDASDDFSGDWADLQNVPTGFVDDLDDVDDADSDPTNELQDLNLSGNILTITGIGSPTQINLASYTGTNTDEQNLQFSGGQITLSGDPDNTIIDLSNYDSDVSDDFSNDDELDPTVDESVKDGVDWTELSGIPAGFSDDTDDVDDADADPTNELQTISKSGTTVTLSGGGGSFSVNDGDASSTNEIELQAGDDIDGNKFREYTDGNYLKAINFLSTPVPADDSNITGGVLDLASFKFARTLLFTPDAGKGSTISEIKINNGISGQELIIINVGTMAISFPNSASNSNLYVPDAASINPGGSIHFMYVDDGKGFNGWITIAYVPNVGAPKG